jgi:hypothetical protein
MSNISTIIITLSVLATILFAVGFIRGVKNAMASFRAGGDDSEVTDLAHWPSVIFAVLASAFVIAAVGFSAAFVYAGPILVIVSGAATGLAFFLEEAPQSQVSTTAQLARA